MATSKTMEVFDEWSRLKKLAAETNAWIQDIDGVTRPSLLKQTRESEADRFYTDNHDAIQEAVKQGRRLHDNH